MMHFELTEVTNIIAKEVAHVPQQDIAVGLASKDGLSSYIVLVPIQ